MTRMSTNLGFAKMLARIRKTFYWSLMVEDIRQYCRTCDSCQRMKPPHGKRAGLLQPIMPDGVPASHWGADFIGPLPKGTGGVKYVLIALDYTRLVVVRAARKADGSDADISQGICNPKVQMDKMTNNRSRGAFPVTFVVSVL